LVTKSRSSGNGSTACEVGAWWASEANRFSLWRRYYGLQLPLHDAERSTEFRDQDEPPECTLPPLGSGDSGTLALGPFPNISAFWFADWWWNGGNEKSSTELQKLLALGATDGFSFEDALTTNWKSTMTAFDGDEEKDDNKTATDSDSALWFNDANWITSPITIPVPFHRLMKNSGTRDHAVGEMKHRRLVPVIEEKIRNTKPGDFHYQPYELVWSPPSASEGEQLDLRVQGEFYNSPSFVEAHQELQNSPLIAGCSRERVVVALMLWSDETHLSSFGSAKLWPIYLFFGNESKYRRSKTSLKLCEHIAYLESVGPLAY
jgi:Plavaka transposase